MTAQNRNGKLDANIMHFARVLRAAGIPVGPRSVVDAVRAAGAGLKPNTASNMTPIWCFTV